MTDVKDNIQADVEHNDDSYVQSRRDAMKKMGKYATYTAPAMLTLLATRQSMAGESIGPR
jgi:hypothetical protein